MLIRICKELFSGCMVMGLITGILTHAGWLPMQPGILISTYFIVVTTATFIILVKKDPESAVLPEATDSVYVKVKAGAKIVAGVVLAGIWVLNAVFYVKMLLKS